MKPRSVMIYGASGSTKSSQLYHIVKWILNKPENKDNPKARFRMIYSDGGGYVAFEDSGLVAQKRIQLMDFSSAPHALAHYRWLSEGYWPIRTKEGVYFAKDENCRTKDWENVLGYIIEGFASTAEALKTHISNQKEGVGFKESWRYEEEGETLIGLQQGHYGMIQKEMYERHMRGFKNLPMQWLLVSSLLGKGVDKRQGIDVYGPQLAGDAMTYQVPSWFMDCFHLDVATWEDDKGSHTQPVAWFTNHCDSMGVPYLAKARCMPEMYPELLKKFPNGFVPLGYKSGLEKYFKFMEEMKNAT